MYALQFSDYAQWRIKKEKKEEEEQKQDYCVHFSELRETLSELWEQLS